MFDPAILVKAGDGIIVGVAKDMDERDPYFEGQMTAARRTSAEFGFVGHDQEQMVFEFDLFEDGVGDVLEDRSIPVAFGVHGAASADVSTSVGGLLRDRNAAFADPFGEDLNATRKLGKTL